MQDMRYCTQTGFKTLENYHKDLVCKELRHIWEKDDDPSIPWKKGDFNETNTVLLDDSPYKSLLNPVSFSSYLFNGSCFSTSISISLFFLLILTFV